MRRATASTCAPFWPRPPSAALWCRWAAVRPWSPEPRRRPVVRSSVARSVPQVETWPFSRWPQLTGVFPCSERRRTNATLTTTTKRLGPRFDWPASLFFNDFVALFRQCFSSFFLFVLFCFVFFNRVRGAILPWHSALKGGRSILFALFSCLGSEASSRQFCFSFFPINEHQANVFDSIPRPCSPIETCTVNDARSLVEKTKYSTTQVSGMYLQVHGTSKESECKDRG